MKPDFENCSKFYCHCQRPSFGQMIDCDNSNCEKEWFHYKCVGPKQASKRKWFYVLIYLSIYLSVYLSIYLSLPLTEVTIYSGSSQALLGKFHTVKADHH